MPVFGFKDLLVLWTLETGVNRGHQCFSRELVTFVFSIVTVPIKTFVFRLISLSTCVE